MGRARQAGLVIGGYVAAFGGAALAGWAYDVRVSSLPYDTSGGMYAGGQLLQELGVFLLVALLPTLYALWLLRRNAGFWNTVAAASLAFAVGGLCAVLTPLVTGSPGRSAALAVVELLALSQFLGMPLWFGAFALFAVLAPTRPARRMLVGAIGTELAIGVLAVVHWFSPRPPF